jgi:hypothetical protein
MKTKLYLRIAKNLSRKGGFISRVSSKPDYEPVSVTDGRRRTKFYPTVSFVVEIELPDEAFKKAEQVVARLNIENEQVKVNEIKSSI